MPQPQTPSKVLDGKRTLYRYAPAVFSTVSQGAKRFDSNYYVEGYASTFDQPYELGRDLDNNPYYEVISSRALDGADMSDVIMQFDHSGMVAARQRNNTLLVQPDSHGIFIAADLGKTAAARELYEAIDAGLVDRMSWAFTVAEESWDNENDLRTIMRVKKVYDVSAVSIPANDATEISARACYNGVIESRQAAERLQREKLKIRLRIERGMK